MRRSAIRPMLLACAALVAACAAPPAGAPEPPSERLSLLAASPARSPACLLVRVRDEAGAQQAVKAARGRKVGEIAALGVVVVEPADGDVAGAIARTRGQAGVLWAEPDHEATVALVPNDPQLGNQWGLGVVGASEAWSVTQGAGVRIAVLDTGIDLDHEDLRARVVANVNFSRSRTSDDRYGHGTHVAGIAAAIGDNGRGGAGLAWRAELANVKVLDDDGGGSYGAIANGVVWAADHGCRVINMSLGGPADSQVLREAVAYATARGALVVAAAGNDGTTTPLYPARYDECLAVAATTITDARASFSNHGTWVDLAAPGANIWSTLPNHKHRVSSSRGYGTLSGTSMATPFVAAAAALRYAADPSRGPADVRAAIEGGCATIPGTGTFWTHGRLDAAATLAWGLAL